MVAYNLQNTPKMVGVLFSLVFLLPFFECVGQVNANKNEIELEASFSRDTVFMGDSLEVILTYKNNTGDAYELYPYAVIGMIHDLRLDAFISYENERFIYMLSNDCNYDSVTTIKPSEQIKYKFKIKAKSAFFYKGENNIHVTYLFFDKPKKKFFWNKEKRKAPLSLSSPSIKLYVK